VSAGRALREAEEFSSPTSVTEGKFFWGNAVNREKKKGGRSPFIVGLGEKSLSGSLSPFLH